MRPAAFLDRDGVINAVVWRGDIPASPRVVDEFVFEPGVAASVQRLREAGYLIFVVTNQPDIGRGLMDRSVLNAIDSLMQAEFAPDAVVSCPHDGRENCACRKPKPGMLLDLAARFGVDLPSSWMIGDQDRDMACGKSAGCQTIQLRRGYNTGAGADFRVDDLREAAALMLATTAPA